MPTRIRHVTIDCHAPHSLARFWAPVLGFTDDPDDPNLLEHTEALIVDPTGQHPGLLFIGVPEPKAVKNRIHFDLQPDEGRDVTVDDLVARGATLVSDRRLPDGSGWVVLADPEGNEVCIERSAAERGTPTPVDTGEREMPPVRAAAEREALTGMLDWYRDGVLLKVEGLAPHLAAASPLRSGTTIAGLVKHLALVEDSWFTHRFAGRPEPEPWASGPGATIPTGSSTPRPTSRWPTR